MDSEEKKGNTLKCEQMDRKSETVLRLLLSTEGTTSFVTYLWETKRENQLEVNKGVPFFITQVRCKQM